jgi:hypothetical protein
MIRNILRKIVEQYLVANSHLVFRATVLSANKVDTSSPMVRADDLTCFTTISSYSSCSTTHPFAQFKISRR